MEIGSVYPDQLFVDKITLDFRMDNREFATSFYSGWDSFFYQQVEKVLERILTKKNSRSDYLIIDEIVLDLGTIPEEKLNELFPILLAEKLADALELYLYDPAGNHIRKETEEEYLFETLCRFLMHGVYPWQMAYRFRNIPDLFLTVLQSDAKRLKRFLLTYGHYSGLQERLVFQLSDPELEKGIRLVAPNESVFICSYIHLLRRKYKEVETVHIPETGYRHVLWKIVYAYILNNRSSNLNKKHFVMITITQLAIHYNLVYDELLLLVTYQPDDYGNGVVLPQGLVLILKELRYELEKAYWTNTWKDDIRLYKSIVGLTGSVVGHPLSREEQQALIAILRKPFRCRTFLKPFTEKQIHALVRWVKPQDHLFVCAYADSLDRQQTKGMLEGKAGSEFRLLKWQIIFPLLSEHTGGLIHRTYFVEKVLSQIASHYNLDPYILLLYISTEKVPEELQQVFRILKEKQQRLRNRSFSERVKPRPTDFPDLIKKRKELSKQENEELFTQLRSVSYRRQILSGFTEEDHIFLLNQLFTEGSSFIIRFSRTLDKNNEKGIFNHGQKSLFQRIKWDFIYAVLLSGKERVFNRLYLVETTLKSLSAHYNVTMDKLLSFFYLEKHSSKEFITHELLQVIKQLYHLYVTEKPEKQVSFVEITSVIPDTIYLNNAGLVLLAPFIPSLFNRLGLTEQGAFKGEEEKIKGVFLLQYLANASEEASEYELPLCKLMVGLPLTFPVPSSYTLSREEKECAFSLLEGVIQHWNKLKGTSPAGLREGFLQRPGKLEVKKDHFLITVEGKGYDILLDTIPWNFRVIKMNWMEQPVHVNWR